MTNRTPKTLTGMFIGDDEIIATYGEQAIAILDADPKTQKGKATRPAEARYRPAVVEKLGPPPTRA